MEYFDTLNTPQESELAYARWYSALPDVRKAKMMADMYQFGVDAVRYNVRKENPFTTDADAMLRYMQLNTKRDYTPEIFNFIESKMAERAELEWQKRFKKMKKTLGWTHDDIARFIGASSGNSVKASVNRQIPAFAKLAICVFEEMQRKKEENTEGVLKKA